MLFLHILVVAVTAAGTVAVLTGRFRKFQKRDLFQLTFLACCAGQILSMALTGGCILTQWEQELLKAAGVAPYAGGFLDHYLPWAPKWIRRTLQPLSLGVAGGLLFQGLLVWRKRRRPKRPTESN